VRIAVDTNVLVYAAGLDHEAGKRERAASILTAIPAENLVVPTQVVGEFYNVLIRKGGLPRGLAQAAALGLGETAEVAAHEPATMAQAISIAAAHELQIWDALILAIAAAEGCDLLLSEDMQHGSRYLGVEW